MKHILHHETLSDSDTIPERWLFVLHGIFGAGRNWATLIRRVVRERSEWGSVLVDLREHGDSQGFEPPHTLRSTTDDLQILVGHLGIRSNAILGHSFGGKVALMYATLDPESVNELWIMDSTPEARPPSGGALEMLRIVRRYPGPFPSRDTLIQRLTEEGIYPAIATWMATNLVLRDGKYLWRLDFDAMESLLLDFFQTDLWEIVEAPVGPRIHFVRAMSNSVLSEESVKRIEAAGRVNGRVHLHHLEGGHWLNADNPEGVIGLLTEWLGK